GAGRESLIGVNDRHPMYATRLVETAGRQASVQLKREHHINFWYIILAFMAMLWIQDWMIATSGIETIPYSRFQDLLQQGKLDDLVVGNDRIAGKYKDAPKDKPD